MDSTNLVMETILGRWRSQTLYAGVKLGLFDALDSTPRDAKAIADRLGLDASLLYRLLRALGSLGVVTEEDGARFRLSPAGELLRSDHPRSLRGIALLEEGPEHYALWKHLPDIVRDGRQDAFVREFGHPVVDHLKTHPDYSQVFDLAMTSYSNLETEWVAEALARQDFSNITHLCDVGGGQGQLLCHLLLRYPHLRGTIVERPEVIQDESTLWAGKLGIRNRCTYLPGDILSSVPTADAYILKHMLQGFSQAECLRLLGNMARAAVPRGATVFISEYVVPGPESPHISKFFDIHMMCSGQGRERTQQEYSALLEQSGWAYVETCTPTATGMSVIVGRTR